MCAVASEIARLGHLIELNHELEELHKEEIATIAAEIGRLRNLRAGLDPNHSDYDWLLGSYNMLFARQVYDRFNKEFEIDRLQRERGGYNQELAHLLATHGNTNAH